VAIVSFAQAGIRIEQEREFAELKASVERAFVASNLQKFLKRLESKKVRIRDFDGVLDKQCLEHVDASLKQAGKTAKSLYAALTMSDQAQMREFYLEKLEEVDQNTRHKFLKLYQYY
jgi:hypothetical protein